MKKYTLIIAALLAGVLACAGGVGATLCGRPPIHTFGFINCAG